MEKRVNRVESQVARIFSDINDVDKRLTRIEQTGIQIKYSLYGAIGVYLLTVIGLVETLKMVFWPL